VSDCGVANPPVAVPKTLNDDEVKPPDRMVVLINGLPSLGHTGLTFSPERLDYTAGFAHTTEKNRRWGNDPVFEDTSQVDTQWLLLFCSECHGDYRVRVRNRSI